VLWLRYTSCYVLLINVVKLFDIPHAASVWQHALCILYCGALRLSLLCMMMQLTGLLSARQIELCCTHVAHHIFVSCSASLQGLQSRYIHLTIKLSTYAMCCFTVYVQPVHLNRELLHWTVQIKVVLLALQMPCCHWQKLHAYKLFNL
jgi:hypothetical protein